MGKPEPVFYGHPDDNITDLVFTLCDLPGVVTIASCGGHAKPKRGQRRAGKWFVTFEVYDTPRGMVPILAAVGDTPGLHLTCCARIPQIPGVLTCILEGADVEADAVAARIYSLSGLLGAESGKIAGKTAQDGPQRLVEGNGERD